MLYKLTKNPNAINRVENGQNTTYFHKSAGWDEYEHWLKDGHMPEPYLTEEEEIKIEKTEALTRVKTGFHDQLMSGCLIDNDILIDSTNSDANNFHLAYQGAILKGSSTIEICDKEDTVRVLNIAEFRDLLVTLHDFIQSCYSRKWELRELIRSSCKVTELRIIKW